MVHQKKYLTYALNSSNELVYVKDVPTGDACGCRCPYCNEPLCAKNAGKKKTPHFAHVSGSECSGAYESALHLLAKTILAEDKVIMTPELCLNHESYIIQFDDVKVEERDDELNLRPDCIGYCKKQKYWIEFRNTHEVTAKKITEVVSKKIDCLEIDLRECKLDRDEVKEFIETSMDNRRWVYSSIYIDNDVIMNEDALCQSVHHSVYDAPFMQRHFAVDSKEELVNLTDIASLQGLDMISNPCYCLSCGKPLYLNLDFCNGYYFEHQQYSPECEDKTYLLKLAKKMLIHQYKTRPGFVLELPAPEKCYKFFDCQFKDESSCFQLKVQSISLQGPEYELKDNVCSNELFLIKGKHKIYLRLLIDPNPYHNKFVTNNGEHIISLYIFTEKDALKLEHKIFSSETYNIDFCNFKFQSKEYKPQNRMLFSVFSSGKYYLSEMKCLFERLGSPTTILEIFFKKVLNHDEAKSIGLKYCLDNKIQVCLCEICFFYSKNMSGTAIRKKYKTSKNTSTPTPHYPLSSDKWPIQCPFFSLMKELNNLNTSKYITQVQDYRKI